MKQTKIIESEEEGQQVADTLADGDAMLLMGHGAVTASTRSVEASVMAMAQLEHQARLNYLAMAAGGLEHPSIPLDLAAAVSTANPGAQPHIKARLDTIPGGRRPEGIWEFYRQVVGSDM
jgi:ribulose-5-phosphate 4-epimerase/fuculose-1-phosphate aldolase